MKATHIISLLFFFAAFTINDSSAQTMTFDSGPSEPGFTFSGWNGSGGVIYPASLTVNDIMTIQKSDGGCWNITSFNTAPFGGGAGTWRVYSNQGDELFFQINGFTTTITLNWENIKWFRLQLDDPGNGVPNNTFDFDNVVYNIPTYTAANAPFLIPSDFDVCPGENVTINISGSLNDATTWELYDGGCGINAIQSTAGTVFNVNPTQNTTYCVRGIDTGGCIDPGLCGCVSINMIESSTPPTSVMMSPEIECFPQEVTLTASGGINGNSAVIQWYTGPNGTGSLIGTGTSVTYLATEPATVYARRSGLCNTTNDFDFDIMASVAPIITCPADVIVETVSPICDLVPVTLGAASTLHNCQIAAVWNDAPEFPGLFPLGTTEVLWTALSSNGLTGTCTQQVTVNCVEDFGDICSATPSVASDCAAPVIIGGDNTGSSPALSAGPACFFFGDPSQHGQWFTTTVPAGGNVDIETFDNGGLNDTQVVVYTSSTDDCTGTLTEIACNEDKDGANLDYMSLVELTGLTEGTTLFILVDGYAEQEGSYDLTITYCIGCTDPTACNYNPDANSDDGSCTYGLWYLPIDFNSSTTEPAVLGCSAPAGYELALDQSCVNFVVGLDAYCVDTDWDQACQNQLLACSVPGCTDEIACNYNPAATYEDETCTYPQWYLPLDFTTSETEPTILTCTPPAGYALAEDQDCVQEIVNTDSYCVNTDWDNLCQNSYSACINPITGCLDTTACNFNSSANIDDNSCVYPLENLADFNNDLTVTAADLTGFLTLFGSPCEAPQTCGCKGDLNGDSFITASDLTGFLAEFGVTYAP